MIYFFFLGSGWVIEGALLGTMIFIGALVAIYQIYRFGQSGISSKGLKKTNLKLNRLFFPFTYAYSTVVAGMCGFIVWNYVGQGVAEILISVIPILAFDELSHLSLRLFGAGGVEKLKGKIWTYSAILGCFSGVALFLVLGAEGLTGLERYWLISLSVATILVAGLVGVLWESWNSLSGERG